MASRLVGIYLVLVLLVLAGTPRAGEAGPAPEKAELESPLECQVFQRGPKDVGTVIVKGTAPEAADLVEARCTLDKSATKGKRLDWTPVAQGDALKAGAFQGTLTLPAGGWYALEIRAKKGDGILWTKTVARVGIGDVFITAGQSNSANFGAVRQVAKDDRVVYFDGKGFVHAQDPIPGGIGEGGSPWSLLGDLYVRAAGVPVCFRSATIAYTPVVQWLPPDNEQYKTLIERARWFGPRGVRAVLWHQGESDTLARTSAKDYFDRLGTVIRTMRKDLEYNVDWFVAGASYHPGMPGESEVLRGQRMLWKSGVAFEGPTTDVLVGPYRSDGIHFSQKGLEAHASLWLAVLQRRYLAPVPLKVESK